jgi:hypothetical protein
MVSAGWRAYISFMHTGQRIGQNMQMHVSRKDRRSDLIPVMATIVVAVVGAAGVLWDDLGLGNHSQDRGSAGMITAAAVSRAGAIEIPTDRAPLRSIDRGTS